MGTSISVDPLSSVENTPRSIFRRSIPTESVVCVHGYPTLRRDLCRDDPARSDELHDLYVLNQEYMWKFSNQDDDWNAFTYYVEELDKQLCDAQTQQERKEAQSTLLDMLQEQMGK